MVGTAATARALVGVAVRELAWTIPTVAREMRRWRERAARIPHPGLRADALATLQGERMNAEGAALFAVIPQRRSERLVRLLVAYQVALDYLDTVTERPAPDMRRHGFRLHRALVDAVRDDARISDYYRERPSEDDGGYLRALVEVCQQEAASLPSFDLVRTTVVEAAAGLSVQVLNHMVADDERNRALHAWAMRRGPYSLEWFEATAAASATLSVYALFAAAADPTLRAEDVEDINAAYFPQACLACTLLDSLVDYAEDRAAGQHSYVAYYEDLRVAAARTCEAVAQTLERLRELPNSARHVVIVTGMISMYLSKNTARDPTMRAFTARLKREAGWLTTVEVPVTRLMRWVL